MLLTAIELANSGESFLRPERHVHVHVQVCASTYRPCVIGYLNAGIHQDSGICLLRSDGARKALTPVTIVDK